MAVINRIAGFAEEMAGWRRHLHMNPELGLDCHQTAAFVVERLREFGVDEIHEGIARSGVVAVINGTGEGPVTGLRADMDALPMQEETGAEWASQVEGRMHACGHDGHTAMLLGAAKYLSETRNFGGKAVLIFQPAEETIGGGRIMVEEGMMDRFDVGEVYALHTDPFGGAGEFRTRTGPLLAAVDDFEIFLTGKGGHAAYPDACIDPLPAAAAILQAMQTVVSRNVKPLDELVVSVTQIHGGSAMNIIPESAYLAGTVRSFSPAVRDMAEKRIGEIVTAQASVYGVEARLDYQRNYPATVNHGAQTEKGAEIAREVAGEDNVLTALPPEMGAEDFSYMLEARPGAFFFLGQGVGPSVHHPEFDFNDEVAPVGASFFARLIERHHPVG
ncbi:M20 aminoacylase family protein [Alisedimentitalea sp. MJ-SS2]|uniref:M20 aminoacylase family protein n=1 Tax=Aliisedimentitalea sp. MJ-SS2 TaxID=3049795 RepID=UPI0029129113|nr:M20 aminoacylase family protein [Alisedimentitalea sp. MJ-SS2]MDU8926550.1 M20 aminoacylase family protein [Alisedimentitalea sp. MJ-SS2]